jgi:hypothetical protein
VQDKNPFSQLFPQPTGRNAYEDLVHASELLKTSVLWAEAQQQNTLSSRRRALADMPVRQARTLVESSALKPLESPVRELNASTTFPEYQGMRDLARLLSAEMHVLFSEGRTAAALVSFTRGLRLGSAPKAQVLIGGLVGAAIDSILLTRVKTHLEQLTPRDCDRVQVILREHIEADRGNAEKALAAEMRFVESLIPLLETSLREVVEGALMADEDDTALTNVRTQAEAIDNDPIAKKRVIAAFLQVAKAHQARAQAYLKNPQVLLPEPKISESTIEGALVNSLTPVYTHAVERLLQDRIQCQLLYCHIAIRKYKWETEKLPEKLEQLRLAEWALDPFTRQAFLYEKKDSTYEIYSAGPVDEDGKRTPIHLPWRKN